MKYEKKSFSTILYKFIYESGIVTFQKILISNNSGHAFFFLKVGEKIKLIIRLINILIKSQRKFETPVITLFCLIQEKPNEYL